MTRTDIVLGKENRKLSKVVSSDVKPEYEERRLRLDNSIIPDSNNVSHMVGVRNPGISIIGTR